MNPITLSRTETRILAALAIFGFLIPNGVFVYSSITNQEAVEAAFANPISSVFIVEAFFLMFLFAWLLKKAKVEKPTGLVFIIMSLVGSMVFSVPAALYLILRDKDTKGTGSSGSQPS